MVLSACVCLPVCPTSNNFWLLSNFNISERTPEKQVHPVLDSKESVQDTDLCFTENQVLLVQLLTEPLFSYVTYEFNLFLFQVGKDCSFKLILAWLCLGPGWIVLMGSCEMTDLVLIQVCNPEDLAPFL